MLRERYGGGFMSQVWYRWGLVGFLLPRVPAHPPVSSRPQHINIDRQVLQSQLTRDNSHHTLLLDRNDVSLRRNSAIMPDIFVFSAVLCRLIPRSIANNYPLTTSSTLILMCALHTWSNPPLPHLQSRNNPPIHQHFQSPTTPLATGHDVPLTRPAAYHAHFQRPSKRANQHSDLPLRLTEPIPKPRAREPSLHLAVSEYTYTAALH